MPLYGTGHEATWGGGPAWHAKDQDDRSVTVWVTDEALTDCGEAAIWDTASRKYDSGDVDRSGPLPKVIVTSAECRGY